MAKYNLREKIESELGFSLDEDYILCQTGYRAGYDLSKVRIDHDIIIKKLLENNKVVLMDFKTIDRLNDSYSKFNSDYKTIQVEDIKEQSLLITHAKRCVFFTEGHLRSHTYLPPMFGKDVEVIAAKEIFSFPEAPVSPAAVEQSVNLITEQRLNNYLINHSKYKHNIRMNSVLPYARIVTIESKE